MLIRERWPFQTCFIIFFLHEFIENLFRLVLISIVFLQLEVRGRHEKLQLWVALELLGFVHKEIIKKEK